MSNTEYAKTFPYTPKNINFFLIWHSYHMMKILNLKKAVETVDSHWSLLSYIHFGDTSKGSRSSHL